MATAPSFRDLFGAARREVLSRPTSLTPEAIDTDGTDAQIALAAGAAIGEEVGIYLQGELNAARLATAGAVSDDALEQLGASEYGGETRNGATSAIVTVAFSREAGSATVVPAGTLVGTDGGVTFVTATTALFSSGETGPIEVAAYASTAGSGGNVRAPAIRRVLSTLADPTIIVEQVEDAAGGRPAETRAEFQARLQTVWTRAPRGTLAAIQAAAEAIPRVASARAYEILDGDGQTGRVGLQILGYGRSTNRALAEEVRTAMNSTRAAGVPVVVIAMNPRLVPIRAYGLRVAAGFETGSVLETASAQLLAYIQQVQVGASLTLAEILGVLSSVPGLKAPAGSLLTPTTDVEPAVGEFVDSSRELIYLSVSPAP